MVEDQQQARYYASSDEEDGLLDDDEEDMEQHPLYIKQEKDEEAVLLSNLDVIEISAMTRRTIFFCVLILMGGLGAAGLFFWYGYSEAVKDADDHFDRRSTELVRLMETKWVDYELTALATHEFCQRDNTTHVQFTEFYEYVVAAQLDVQSLQCARNVTNAQRPAIEAESEQYLKETYDYQDYQGFVGLVFDDTGIAAVPNKKQEPYYYIISRMEPFLGNEIAMNLDLKDDELEGKMKLELSWETKKPVLTNRLTTIQETDAAAYAVIIYHPGIPLTTDVPGEYQQATWTSLLVRIPSLLDRVGYLQEENLAIYMYNVLDDVGGREFLGAASFIVEEKGQPATVEYVDEIEFSALIDDHDSDRRLLKRVSIASGSWDVVVVPVDDTYDPSFPFIIFGSVMIFLIGMGVSFWMYSNMRRTVEIYRAKAQAEAERTIVTNLFPETVRERLVEGAKAKNELIRRRARRRKAKGSLNVSDHLTSEALFGSKPIADYYPAVTILCADLAGFTAWSSQREPSQVFSLLEVIYHDFDEVAKRRGIFKVETVGDAYVAAAGVPNYRDDHAVVIARFADNMLDHLHLLVNQLETTLGPDTGDLDIRIGIHSGPVTAGVLRGDKGRFQLFGDTMNMASRMESTAGAGNIQITAETAALLKVAGKGHWIVPRDGKVMVKGKGNLSTFWLKKHARAGSHVSSGGSLGSLDAQEWFPKEENAEKAKVERLVTWNVEQMCILVREIVARRDATRAAAAKGRKPARMPSLRKMSLDTASDSTETDVKLEDNVTPLEQVKDVIYLPPFDEAAFRSEVDAREVRIPSKVVGQLREFVTGIGSMYRANPFHNFEHASHVAMSVTKLLSRIVNPRQHNIEVSKTSPSAVTDVAASIHDHTFGITSDPLTHFAAYFSALIHDVDHPGVPNPVMMEEMPMVAENYKHKSVAEQNSVDLAWLLLRGDEYKEMCEFIFENADEMKRFRQLVINMVMATDVMDKELGALRKERWQKAFDEEYREFKSEDEDKNRKATIVIEHLIQASDVSHTMQHWHVYIRWNENLFMELYDAFRKGRIKNDPSEGWYKGEIGFLTYYVLPLAAKLDTCGVFGVTSDEFRIYASENLKEWTERGEEMVKKYLAKYEENEVKQETAPLRQNSMVNYTNTITIDEDEGEDGAVEEYENEP
eukprot:CAMPEP_0172451244 /NCGR_PEP_ID=MMETSP1065-20121228/9354_1 /TAXON_ID=265537 /ORGANISM="Amphiprora paludosa, Strain CCMP125" /LENGTH=1163 /DNA_ID=CAMNT_0013203175 /DNA_START=91 /DNA_END=3582 /DNA_ORIENTATION=+